MRKVELNSLEQMKYEIIKKLVEEGPTPTRKKRAASKIGCTVRTVNRLIVRFQSEGKKGFSHGNKGHAPITALNREVKKKIIGKYISEYSDANLKHYSDIVREDEGISISPETLRLWLLDENIVSPKAHRDTRKKVKKKLKEELEKTKEKKKGNLIREKIELAERKSSHPRRQRCRYFGEMVQMDASEYFWIKDEKWHLHLAADDASGRVLGGWFDYQETLNGYYHILYQILVKYGIPAMFYTDRRTVFEYTRKKHVFDDEDTFTQFSYCCHGLGIEIKTTSVPQAKGRIERLNGTFQSRLPVELRRANVETIEQANGFLMSYIEKYNSEFALQLNVTSTVFVPQPSDEKINQFLSVISTRVVDQGNCIKFHNRFYMPVSTSGNDVLMEPGTRILVVETFDGQMYLNFCDELYRLRQLKTNSEHSKEFDTDYIEEKKTWSVPKKHPWKTQDFLHFLSKQKHRQNGNQNLC